MNYGLDGGDTLDYGSYLALDDLLSAQRCLTDAHDELLFIVVHQVYELWFKQILFELETARSAMDADDAHQARHAFRRVAAIERLLVAQVDVIETMSPKDFLDFRAVLTPASGFQSVQFREIEFLSGLKDPEYLDRIRTDEGMRARLERRLAEPTLWDAYVAFAARHGAPSWAEVLHDRHGHPELFELGEALLDHDEAFARWRQRHVLMVERQIGAKPGTGGSSGSGYLRSTLAKRFYPALWEARSEM
jgi:tryptophan 2,3-dioxygenase